MTTTPKKIAVLGAGPIGVEAALYGRRLGHDVRVYEREQPGAHVRRWSHVTFFSPWSLDRSAWGAALLRDQGVTLEPGEEFPTGARYLERYLDRLVAHPLLEGRVHRGQQIVGVSRARALKGDHIGQPERAETPFLLLVEDLASGAERFEEADVVIDATGVYGNPLRLGPGGQWALGERALDEYIERHLPDPLGHQRDVYTGERVLVVGAGHSAVTTLRLFHELRQQEPTTEIVWLALGTDEPYERFADDPLPQRERLGVFGNRAASGAIEGLEVIRDAFVERLQLAEDEAIDVTLRCSDGRERSLQVDRVVSNVGYRPDLSILRELQLHTCYASEGPMRLAASLLAAGGGGGDCLAQGSGGPETLQTPEPGLFVLGHKSYGRNSSFLLKLGFEQIEQVFSLIG